MSAPPRELGSVAMRRAGSALGGVAVVLTGLTAIACESEREQAREAELTEQVEESTVDEEGMAFEDPDPETQPVPAQAAHETEYPSSAGDPPTTRALERVEPPNGPAGVGVAASDVWGAYLVDADGYPLYMFTADRPDRRSVCYDDCARVWPPLRTFGDPVPVNDLVRPRLLETVWRRDGTQQVTYAGWPLYYYRQDFEAGMVTGQDVQGFGGDWYLMSPAGRIIGLEEPAAKPP